MKAQLITMTNKEGKQYQALKFVCPGCLEFGGSGLHFLPVNTTLTTAWAWNGDLEKPTLSAMPGASGSIMSSRNTDQQCHSYLTDGVFHFIGDSKHSLRDQHVPIPDLPDWAID